jgi:excisionase family DNA binding protein
MTGRLGKRDDGDERSCPVIWDDKCMSGVGFEKLMTPAEVAAFFGVDPKTVTRWAKSGKLSAVRTLGGHRRYMEREVRKLHAQTSTQRMDG